MDEFLARAKFGTRATGSPPQLSTIKVGAIPLPDNNTLPVISQQPQSTEDGNFRRYGVKGSFPNGVGGGRIIIWLQSGHRAGSSGVNVAQGLVNSRIALSPHPGSDTVLNDMISLRWQLYVNSPICKFEIGNVKHSNEPTGSALLTMGLLMCV